MLFHHRRPAVLRNPFINLSNKYVSRNSAFTTARSGICSFLYCGLYRLVIYLVLICDAKAVHWSTLMQTFTFCLSFLFLNLLIIFY